MFVRVTAGQRSMEINSDEAASFDFSAFNLRISAFCACDTIYREVLVTITEEECLELLTGLLSEQGGAAKIICSNDKILYKVLDYARDNSERVKSVFDESICNLLESNYNESIDNYVSHRGRCEKEIEQLTKRVAELEAIIRNAKESLGVPHLTAV